MTIAPPTRRRSRRCWGEIYPHESRGPTMLNRQTRSIEAGQVEGAAPGTFTGNRALQIEEPLIFELGRTETTGVDIGEPAAFESRLGGLERTAPIGLPGLSEPETMRHYVRLSQKNYGI